jgi:antitoxin component YwqK of YwqJK toxin-antitoxin module
MKKILTLLIALPCIGSFAQKTKPVLQTTLVSTTVNEGTKNHFSDNVNKRDLTFTIDAEAKLNGEIIIKNPDNSALIFKGMMKDNYLVDSAMWYENNNLVKVVHFKDKCCSSATDYVDPTSKVLSSIKGERQGVERIYFPSNPGIPKAVYTYQGGKKHGKQYEFDSTKTLTRIRNYKDGKLHDTSFVNCHRKNPDLEIYANDVPAGVWKKHNQAGVLVEKTHKQASSDSTIYYGGDSKILSIVYKSVPEYGLRTCREYNEKGVITKTYFLKFGGDTVGEVLHGMYEEYAGGKIKIRGEYWYGTQIETWITYNAKGAEIKWDSYTSRDVAMAVQPDVIPVTTTQTAVAVDLFPPALSKSAITMTLESNGKIEKLFKKTEEINWELDVKSSTDYKVVCNDPQLTESERADVVSYLISSITAVKGVRYSHKEVAFVTKYKLLFK